MDAGFEITREQRDAAEMDESRIRFSGVDCYLYDCPGRGLVACRTLLGVDAGDNVIRERHAPETVEGITAPAVFRGPALVLIPGGEVIPVRVRDPVPDVAAIVDLRTEAIEAGDTYQGRLCDEAIDGDASAVDRCREVIDWAASMADD